MLKSVEIPVSWTEGERLNSSAGSILHGALMDLISKEDAERFHEEGLRPYSQGLYWNKDKNTAIWRINVLNETAEETILLSLLQEKELFLRHRQQRIHFSGEIEQCESSFQKITDDMFQSWNPPTGADMDFLTPVSFKRDGRYVIWPELDLIWQSLFQRWNEFSPLSRIEEENLASRLSKVSYISRYRLHTQAFSLEGRSIYGFAGRISIRFTGPDMSRRLLGLLTCFAPFAGIGIKTALGMGQVKVRLHRKDNSNE